MNDPLDIFGEFVVLNLHDKMLFDLDTLLKSGWKSPGLQNIQSRIQNLSECEKALVREIVLRIIEAGMHDFLFALQEEYDNKGLLHFFVEGEDVAGLSDGIHGEIFGDDGWINRFSKYLRTEKSTSSRTEPRVRGPVD